MERDSYVTICLSTIRFVVKKRLKINEMYSATLSNENGKPRVGRAIGSKSLTKERTVRFDVPVVSVSFGAAGLVPQFPDGRARTIVLLGLLPLSLRPARFTFPRGPVLTALLGTRKRRCAFRQSYRVTRIHFRRDLEKFQQ